MTLTTLIQENRSAVRLFSLLPDFKSVTKRYQPIETEKRSSYIAKHEKANPEQVERAYGMWCRAYIQKENQNETEILLHQYVVGGLDKAFQKGYVEEEEVDILLENVNVIWKMRSDFINGKSVDEDLLLKGCLVLSYLEDTYLHLTKPPRTYLDIRIPDFIDLKNLCESTKTIPRIFKTDKDIWMNPTFGAYSQKVGGAGADYIIGNMLVNIQTDETGTFQKNYLHQLVGCYLLSVYDETFPCDIQQIGVFFPRFKKLVYIDISDIEKEVHVDVFSNWFKEIVEGDEKTIGNVNYQMMKRKMYA